MQYYYPYNCRFWIIKVEFLLADPPRGAGAGPGARAEEQRVARVFIMVALVVLVLIIFS